MRNESAKREMSAKRRVRGGMPGFGTLASELDKLEARVLFAVAPLPPVVSITQVTGEAWEAAPSTHPGVLRLTRTGSTATALTVTLGIQGTAVAGTNYKLTGPNGNIVVFNGLAQVTIPIGAASADITIVPLEDNTANGPLTVQVIVAFDVNPVAKYRRSDTLALTFSTVTVQDSGDVIQFYKWNNGIVEGLNNQIVFYVSRTAAPGGNLNHTTNLPLSFTGGTFSAAQIVGASTSGTGNALDGNNKLTVSFAPGQGAINVFLSTADNGTANGTQTINVTADPVTNTLVGTIPTVNVIDASPTVTIAANPRGILEGTNGAAFELTRTAPAGTSLVGQDTKVVLTYTGTFGASAHGFTSSQVIDFGTTGNRTIIVSIASTDNNAANGTQTVIGTLTQATGSDFTPVNLGAAATLNVTDASPSVTIKANSAGITEGTSNAQVFTLTRTAPTGGTLVGVDTKVNVAFTGTFAATGHGFASSQVIDFGTTGATTAVVTLTSTDEGVGNGTQTIIGTISSGTTAGFTPFNIVTASATTNVTDASPTVTLTGKVTTATSTGSTLTPGIIVLTRSGPVTANLPVLLKNSTGSGFGVEGTNFTLFANGTKVVNDIVTIPAGKSFVQVQVNPLDNHINDSLKTTVALGTGAWNNGTSSSATITLTNNNRVPLIGNPTVQRLAARNGTLTFSFDDLVSLAKAGLANGSLGTLQLTMTTIPIGTAKLIKAGTTTQTAAAANTTISKGDVLIWTAPTNTKENKATFMTIGAVDGTVKSTVTSAFQVTII